MRYSLYAALFGATLSLAAFSFGDAPVALDKKADDARFREIPALRQTRKDLAAIEEELHKDVPDPSGHRHKAYDQIKLAIGEISAEIDEYKGDEIQDKK